MTDPKKNIDNENKNINLAVNLREIKALNGIITPTTSRNTEYVHCACVDDTEKSLIK